MSINVSFHFTTVPTVEHRDFPDADKAFTCAVLLDEHGVEHRIYLPLGARLAIEHLPPS